MTLRLLTVPTLTSLGEPGGWMYEGMRRVMSARMIDMYGHDDCSMTAEQRMVDQAMGTDFDKHRVVAVDGADDPDNVVGFGWADLPLTANPTMAFINAEVRPDRRGQGIGAELAQWAETTAAEHGRTSWMVGAPFASAQPGQATVTAEQGDAVPASTPGLVFALARGYTLRQVERWSRLDLPVAEEKLARFHDEALAHSQGYRIHRWLGTPPEQWLGKLGALTTAMSTDPPFGGLTLDEDPWDADRLRQGCARLQAMGYEHLTVAVEHISSAALVAYTDMEPRSGTPWAEQSDTIVHRDHRGHRLGMLIKVANLRWLAERHPQVNRIYTWNASENTHMLAINLALGFYPVGGEASLQKGDEST